MNNNEKIDEAVGDILASVVPFIILAKFAHWSIILTALLALLSLVVTLPFHFLWGFSLVPIGGLIAIYAGKRVRVITKPR